MDPKESATLAMLRAMVAMGLAGGDMAPDQRATVKKVYRMAAGADLDDRIIDAVATEIAESRRGPRELMAASVAGLGTTAKQRIVQCAYFVMTAAHDVGEAQAACLLAISEGLGLTRTEFEAAIEELEAMAGTGDGGHGASPADADLGDLFLTVTFRAMVAMAICDGPMTPEERETIRHFFAEVGLPVDDATIDGYILALDEMEEPVGDMLARDAGGIDPALKPRIVQSVYLVMLAHDPISEEEGETLAEVARGLGVGQAEMERALATVTDLLSDG